MKDKPSGHPEGWPAWATWSWERSYLPDTLHASDDELHKFLQVIDGAKISGLASAMRLALGFGMLLRECKRAIEYEADEVTPGMPHYIGTSILDTRCLDLIIDALNRTRGGVVRMSKARAVEQGKETPRLEGNEPKDSIAAQTTVGSGEEAQVDKVDKPADQTQQEESVHQQLTHELQLLDEQKKAMEILKEKKRLLQEAHAKIAEENRMLEKEIMEQQKDGGDQGQEVREDEEQHVSEPENEKESEAGEEEQEVEVKQRGKKRKSGESATGSKKSKPDHIRRSSRARLPSKKASRF